MYTIKHSPGDFIVEEVVDALILPNDGKYAIFSMRKQSMNTIQVIDILTKKLRLKKSDIGFAGIKDRHAITTQYISIPLIPNKIGVQTVLDVNLDNVTLIHLGFSHKHIATPQLTGNKFTITIRDWSEYIFTPQTHMLNYFGEQRFSHNNADVGHAFVNKDFKKAVELLLAYSTDESKQTYNERTLANFLEKEPTNYISALRELPGQTCKFFLHAYQSKLWNETVSQLTQQKVSTGYVDSDIFAFFPTTIPADLPPKIPAVGYFYDEEDWSEDIQEVIRTLFKRDGITERNFVIRQMSEITEPGAIRDTIVPINDLVVLEQTTEKLVLSFTLNRGSYATVALRQMLQLKV